MTTLQPQTWEYTLLGLAHEALHPAVLAVLKPVANRHLFQRAYAYCTELTAAHSRSFYLATRWLPAEKRRAIRAPYPAALRGTAHRGCGAPPDPEALSNIRRPSCLCLKIPLH